jgi:hypothetical protein
MSASFADRVDCPSGSRKKKARLENRAEIHQRRRMEETTLITLREINVGISVIRII